MSEGGGWLNPHLFRAGSGQDLPVVSVTRVPPELARRTEAGRPLPRGAGEPGYGGPDLALGSVSGYRWWAVDGSLARSQVLRGMHAAWTPGENTARCLAGHRFHLDSTVPDSACYCGFYAWWHPQDQIPPVPALYVPAFGVVQGYGRVLIGTKGFRCAKARILALHLLMRDDAPKRVRDGIIARLGGFYPDAALFRDPAVMLAEYPPDARFAP